MTRLAAEGISIDVPRGWDARIFRRAATGAETTHAVLHAANLALPGDAADYGDGVVQLMGSAHVLLTLVEFHPASTETALFSARGMPRALQAADADRTTLQRALGGQAGIQRFFTEAGRAWCLYVVLGSYANRAALLDALAPVLASIEMTPVGADR